MTSDAQVINFRSSAAGCLQSLRQRWTLSTSLRIGCRASGIGHIQQLLGVASLRAMIAHHVHQQRRLLLEGEPNIGKSTVIQRLSALLIDAGVAVGGFITREVLGDDGRRVGFRVRDIAGSENWLAHQDFDTGIRVGRFGVDLTVFEEIGVAALRRARDQAGVIVIDEIARMELASMAFTHLLEDLLAEPRTVVATVHVHQHPVSDALKQRNDIELIAVTESNRNDLPAQLFRLLTTDSAPPCGSG